MRILLPILLLLAPLPLHSQEWVVQYSSWSNWGDRGDVWINSKNNFVFNDSENFQTIPCIGSLTPTQLKNIDVLIQKIIITKPKHSMNYESDRCNDEPQAEFRIVYGGEVLKDGVLPIISERFSLWPQCNDNPVEQSWVKLANEIESFASSQVKLCDNSPFK